MPGGVEKAGHVSDGEEAEEAEEAEETEEVEEVAEAGNVPETANGSMRDFLD